MKRAVTTLFVSMVALVASVGLATAALRVPQVPVVGAGLQAYLTSVGQTINVATDQDANQSWTHTASATTSYTVMFQSSPNANVQQFGLYNAGAAIPPLYFILSGSIGPFGYSTATFKPGALMTVNRFDALANFLNTTTYGGVDETNFGFYLTVPAGTVFTQDPRNPGGLARAIVFKGTGSASGNWWLCFDEPGTGGPGDGDFDDLVILMESVNPTPTHSTTWGALKARFR
jgi:hypothetical protein